MELYSSTFFPAVLKILQSNIPLLATIPIPKYGRDIPGGNIPYFFIYHGRYMYIMNLLLLAAWKMKTSVIKPL